MTFEIKKGINIELFIDGMAVLYKGGAQINIVTNRNGQRE